MLSSLSSLLLGDLPRFVADPLGFVEQRVVGQAAPVAARLGPRKVTFLARPSAVRHVMVTAADRYGKGDEQARLKPLLGDGMVTASGERWRQSRSTVRPNFGGAGLEDGLGHAMAVLGQEVTRLSRQVGGQIQLHPLMGRLTLRMAAAALFHVRLNDHTAEEVYQAGLVAHRRLSETMWRPIDLDALLPTGENRRYRRAIRTLEGVVADLAREPKGVLAALAPLAERHGGSVLRDEAITMLVASFETTAMAATWLAYVLAARPDLVAWLREEVDETLSGGRGMDPAGLRQMRRTRALVQEVLRLYPSIWWFARVALTDDEIDGVAIPKGGTVLLCPWALHRQPDLWPDPARLDPQRFMNDAEIDKYAYIPFGIGARSCIGSHLARAELMAIAAMLVSAFELAPLSGDLAGLRPLGGVTLAPPVQGLRVGLSLRARYRQAA